MVPASPVSPRGPAAHRSSVSGPVLLGCTGVAAVCHSHLTVLTLARSALSGARHRGLRGACTGCGASGDRPGVHASPMQTETRGTHTRASRREASANPDPRAMGRRWGWGPRGHFPPLPHYREFSLVFPDLAPDTLFRHLRVFISYREVKTSDAGSPPRPPVPHTRCVAPGRPAGQPPQGPASSSHPEGTGQAEGGTQGRC